MDLRAPRATPARRKVVERPCWRHSCCPSLLQVERKLKAWGWPPGISRVPVTSVRHCFNIAAALAGSTLAGATGADSADCLLRSLSLALWVERSPLKQWTSPRVQFIAVLLITLDLQLKKMHRGGARRRAPAPLAAIEDAGRRRALCWL